MGPRHFFEEIPSTQDHAAALARAGAPAGTVVRAGSQTHGRGRLAHGWASPPGGLYLSKLATGNPAGSGLMPLAVGLELRRALLASYDVGCRIKWPNDLVVVRDGRPRKIAGVLVDRISQQPEGTADVIGIGINANAEVNDYPAELQERIATLRGETGRMIDLDQLESETLASIDLALERLNDPARRRQVIRELGDLLYGLGRTVRVDGADCGRVKGVADDGALRVGEGESVQEIHAGDVVVAEG